MANKIDNKIKRIRNKQKKDSAAEQIEFSQSVYWLSIAVFHFFNSSFIWRVMGLGGGSSFGSSSTLWSPFFSFPFDPPDTDRGFFFEADFAETSIWNNLKKIGIVTKKFVVKILISLIQIN